MPEDTRKSPADYPAGVMYLMADPTEQRAGDVLVLENVELAAPDEKGLRIKPRIVARFYSFRPDGETEVAQVMAEMFVSMANDGAEAYRVFTAPRSVTVVNPAARLIAPGGGV